MLLSIAYIGGIATVRGAIFAGVMLAPGGLAFTAMERWFELGRYQPLVAGVGVILSAILNPDGVTAKARQHLGRSASRAKDPSPARQDSITTPQVVGGAT
jgi:branched-chain amino acid transport system permease protein